MLFWYVFLGYEWLVPSISGRGPSSVPSPASVVCVLSVSFIFWLSCSFSSVPAMFPSSFLVCFFSLWCSVLSVSSFSVLVCGSTTNNVKGIRKSNQISSYFDSIFHPCVSGFRKGYGCKTVLVNMIQSIKCSLYKGNIVCCILMDLIRAFDCIPHKLLISKFKAYGVSVSACDVITNYLKDRRQRVKIGTQRSEWMHAHKGSAQGSLFGPFSYNVFTNYIFNLIDDDVEIYNYADDNTILCSGKWLTDIKVNYWIMQTD